MASQIDGPRLPRLLMRLWWSRNPRACMDACAKRYGDIFQVDLGLLDRPVVVTGHPEAMQQLFSAGHQQLDSGKALYDLAKPMAGENSIGVLDGSAHQRQRRLMMPPFLGKSIQSYRTLIVDLATQAMESWQIGEPRVISEVLKDVTLRVILQSVFGIYDGPRYEKLRVLFSDMMEGKGFPFGSALLYFKFLQVDLGRWSPWGKFQYLIAQIDELLYAEIRDRRAYLDPERTDVLSLLMLARDEEGQAMSDIELRDELMTLLHSGHSTTNAALSWAFYFIHRQPEVRQKLMAELTTQFDPQDLAAAEKLPYLQAVVQETLRIYPVSLVALARIARNPIEILGKTYETGTVFFPAIYLTHRRADLYPDPETFRPERFLERQFSIYEYLPFGGGHRMCIGTAFAQMQMRLILATILSRWELSLVSDQPVQPGRRGLGGIKPSGGVPMVLTGQRNARSSVSVSRT
ncbi:MAG: cytochrome P450 [Anaerolineae bacterium]|nr:cytochrome P450 [Gloeobacterales cyanobacterium ES-bin-313]